MSLSYLYVCKITALICQHKELFVFLLSYAFEMQHYLTFISY